MSLTITVQENKKTKKLSPSFIGAVRSEFFKLSHQRTLWIMWILLVGLMLIPWVRLVAQSDAKDQLISNPLHFLENQMEGTLALIRVFIGFFLLVLTALSIGLDYQHGTIRIILSRGMGRVPLLCVKLLAVAGYALITLVGCLAITTIVGYFSIDAFMGNTNAFNAVNDQFWSNARLYLLSVIISMGVTILVATAATVLGRSLSIGLGVGLVFFPADNIASAILVIINHITQNDFWLKISAYLLGPNLNVLPELLLPSSVTTQVTPSGIEKVTERAFSMGPTPFVNYDTTHTFVVIAVYSAIFALVAFVLTWKHEVLE